MNLTDRQVELIGDLLITYENYGKYVNEDYYDKEIRAVKFIFNNKVFQILEPDYNKVCEIIDYIKGVKNGI